MGSGAGMKNDAVTLCIMVIMTDAGLPIGGRTVICSALIVGVAASMLARLDEMGPSALPSALDCPR